MFAVFARSFAMLATVARQPVLVVAGPTGSGKSKLGLQLGQRFDCEIINADSMQVYRGLDIITNKVTADEMRMVHHHLIGYLDPLHSDNHVTLYRDKAIETIRQIRQCKKLPILCGGTCYYIESVLWHILVDADTTTTTTITTCTSKTNNIDTDLKSLSNEQLHNKLLSLDKSAALRFHPHERRKVERAVQICLESGNSDAYSSLLKSQHLNGDSFSGSLRFPKDETAIFWIRCDMQILDKRLDKRVDQMLTNGLLEELENFHKDYNSVAHHKDYTLGIFQSIGFKEFHDYLMLSVLERKTDEGQRVLSYGVERLKARTRQYARQQEKWLRNRFLGHPESNYIPVYILDGSDASEEAWHRNVYQPAERIVASLQEGLSHDHIHKHVYPHAAPSDRSLTLVRELNTCEACNKVFNLTSQFEEHMKSKSHQKRLKGLKKVDSKRDNLINKNNNVESQI